MMDLHLFIPITKIDMGQRLVFGTIAEEIPDLSGEIMDYETAKPEFEAWSAEIRKASNGRSVGNLRAMHGSVAAGKLDQIHFDDDAKRIATVAKVVDDAEWKKVLEGVYTGFSMGGRYVNRWSDPENPSLTRYTPRPQEVSLVDHPCIPSATFEVVKTDGTVELRKFKRSGAERDASREALDYADPGYRPDKKKRYPLDTEAHIRAAWAYIHHPRNEKPYSPDQIAKIKAKIIAAWRAKIDRNGPPLAAGKAAGMLAKNLGDVSQLAEIIDDLSQLVGELDGPDSDLLRPHLESLIALLNSLVSQIDADFTPDSRADDDSEPDGGEDTAGGDEEDDGADAEDDDDENDASGDTNDAPVDKRAEPLRKALASVAPRIDAVSAQVENLTKRLEHLEAQPLPGGPVAKFVTVSKTRDRDGYDFSSSVGDPLAAFQRHLETLDAGERAHLLTKLALRNPIVR